MSGVLCGLRWWSLWVGLAAAAWARPCLSAEASAGTGGLPSPVRTALERNAAGLGPLTVSWKQQYQSTLPPAEAAAKMHIVSPPPEIFFLPQERSVAWQDGKIYSWTKDGAFDAEGKLVYIRQELSSNGEVFCSGRPERQIGPDLTPPLVMKRPLAGLLATEPNAKYFDCELLAAAGFRLPSRVVDLKAGRALAEPLRMLESGGRLVSVEPADLEGRKFLRVSIAAENPEWREAQKQDPAALEKEMRISGRNSEEAIQEAVRLLKQSRKLPPIRHFAYYLDPELQYAVRRCEESYEKERLLVRTDNSRLEELAGRKIWLPRRCVIEYYTFGRPGEYFDPPILRYVLDVTAVDLNPIPADRFVLHYTMPGTLVSDGTFPEAKLTPSKEITYSVPPTLSELEEVIDQARKRAADPEGHVDTRTFSSKLFLALNVAALAAILLILAVRAWSRSKTR